MAVMLFVAIWIWGTSIIGRKIASDFQQTRSLQSREVLNISLIWKIRKAYARDVKEYPTDLIISMWIQFVNPLKFTKL